MTKFGSKNREVVPPHRMMRRVLILSGGGARGAFQAGVWKYLQEIAWTPDLICGTSIGAVNGAAIASGMSAEQLIHLWSTHHRSKVYRLDLLRWIAAVLFKRPLRPMLDSAPMRQMLSRHLDLDTLRHTPTEIIITAVNLATGRLHLYTNQDITIDHLLASGAMPIFFPWQYIKGEPYWDGGVMANSPLFPTLKKEADDIIVVLLSPVGKFPMPVPTTLLKGLELVLEHFLSGSYQATMPVIRSNDSAEALSAPSFQNSGQQGTPGAKQPRVAVVAPSRMLGLASLLNFSPRQTRRLVKDGYSSAREQLQYLV